MEYDRKIEQRLTLVEQKLARQSDVNQGLLDRSDQILEKVQQVARDQNRMFDEMKAGQKELEHKVDTLETAVGTIVETLKDHKAGIEALDRKVNALEEGQKVLLAGQEQILALLTGKPKTND